MQGHSGGGEGAEVIYALRNTDALAKSVLTSIGNAGQPTRKYYQRRLPSDPSKDYYFIHRETGKITPLRTSDKILNFSIIITTQIIIY